LAASGWPISRRISASGSGLLAKRLKATAPIAAPATDHVDEDADEHRADDADLEVAARILGLLGRGRDRIEAVEGEEDDRRRGHDADLGAGRPALGKAVGHERVEVARVEIRQGDRDEDDEGEHLHRDQDRVQGRAFLEPVDQQAGDHRR
jgi:hypothetical protein